MTIEQLDRVLDYPTIEVEPFKEDGVHFERRRKLTVDGRRYEIEWWKNISYIHYDGLTIPFDRVKQSNTWSHRSKMKPTLFQADDI